MIVFEKVIASVTDTPLNRKISKRCNSQVNNLNVSRERTVWLLQPMVKLAGVKNPGERGNFGYPSDVNAMYACTIGDFPV
jgi:hypothetical protein